MHATLSFQKADSPNLAPAAGLQAAKDRRKRDSSVEVGVQWFRSYRDELARENNQTWDNQILLWQLIFAFVEGNTLGRRGRNGGWRWASLPKTTDQPVYGLNLARFYSRNIKAKWVQSNTDVVWRPVSDVDDAEGAAKFATKVHDYYRRVLYTQNFRQSEAMLAQCGKYARYYYYSEDAKRYARRERISKQQLQLGDGSWFCADCGEAGSGSEIRGGDSDLASVSYSEGDESLTALASGLACPACGSPNLDIEQPESVEVESVDGYEFYETGDIVCETVPPFELKHDIALPPHESPYLIRRRRVRVAVLQSKYPDLKVSPSDSGDEGLRREAEIRKAVYGSQRSSVEGASDEPTAELVQVWLDPCLYATLKLKEPLKTVSGVEIPAGVPLIELFPEGMYQCWIEGIEGMVDLRNEHHKDFWVGGEYDKRVMSSLGVGLEDIVQGGMQYNLIMSIIYAQLRSSALPATLFEQKLLPGGMSSYLGSLSNIPVDTTTLEGKSLRDVVHQLTPQPPTGQHFSYAQQIEYFVQKASMVTDFSGGLPGVNNATATGAQIAAANSQGLFAPQLGLKADVDRRGAEIIIELFRKYTPDEIFLAVQGRRGAMEGDWFSAAKINVQMFAEVVPDSYLPQTNLERRQRWDEFLSKIGGLPGLRMALQEMPGFVETLAELHDVDLGSEDYTAAANLCALRLKQMEAALPTVAIWLQQLPLVQVVADPTTGMPVEAPVDPKEEAGKLLLDSLQPPIEPEEIGHLAAVMYLRSSLTEDRYLNAPPELRAGIKAMIRAHIDGMAAEAQIRGGMAMAAQPMPPEMPPEAMPEPAKPKNTSPDAKQMQPGGQRRANPRDSQTKALVAAKSGAIASA